MYRMKLLRFLLSIILIFFISCGSGVHVKNHPFKDSSIFNFGKVDDNVYRGSQPLESDYIGLKKLGIKTVLDLRDDQVSTSPKFAKMAGLEYKHVTMSSTHTPRLKDVQTAEAILRDPLNWPVFVHCEGGRHRTGVIVAVYRVIVSKWTIDKAWGEALKYDYYSDFGHQSIETWFLRDFKPELF